MKNLKRYLADDLRIECSEKFIPKFMIWNSYCGLQRLLETCFVLKNSRIIDLPQISPSNDHKLIIDECITFLLDHQLFDNILTLGYTIGRNGNVNSALHCVSANTQVTKIKGPLWQLVHQHIGTRNFVDLLINRTVVEYNGSYFTQIIGNRMNRPHAPPIWCQKSVPVKSAEDQLFSPFTIRQFLYRNSVEMRFYNILPSGANLDVLIKTIFDPEAVKLCKAIKNKVSPILRKLIHNHRTRIKYLQVLDKICPRTDSVRTKHHLELRTQKRDVHRFLVVILEKLIPLKMFGSKKNKSEIFSKLAQILEMTSTGALDFQHLIQNLRLKDFIWLRVSDTHFSKNDFKMSLRLLSFFISWLFKILISRIISTFFYCTEVSSSSGEVFYFRHDIWNAISVPFISQYFNKNLVENTVCRNHDSYLLSAYNHVRFRIVPKKAKDEFRVITVPHKGADGEEYAAFKDNMRRTTIPTQAVLEYLRNKRNTFFRKVYSANQIAGHLKDFHCSLLKKYKHIPSLHCMKFDIDSCYDSILRTKIMELLRMLLKDEDGFFIRPQTILDPSSGSLKTINVVNGSKKPADGEVYIDNVRTSYFTNDDFLNILKLELFSTSISYAGRCFLRKDGLFQGASFSALLVDLVYDDLLLNYNMFRPRGPAESLIIRLADDFLFITSDKAHLLEVKEAVQKGFHDYNAKVKKEKLIYVDHSSSDPTIEFCGLNISITDLNIWKSCETLGIPKIYSLSTMKTYQKLSRYFEMKLSYGTIDLELNRPATVIHQLKLITQITAEAYVASFKYKKINPRLFAIFFDTLYYHAESLFFLSRSDHSLSGRVYVIMAESFLQGLLQHQSQFAPAIHYLRESINHANISL